MIQEPWLRRVEGRVPEGLSPFSASICYPQFVIRKVRMTEPQRRGLAYERKVIRGLRRRYGDALLVHPWIYVAAGSKGRLICPDALLFLPSGARLILIEIKLRHCVEAFWQLRYLYGPAVRRLFPNWRLCMLEICRWFDEYECVGEEFKRCRSIEDADGELIGVHIGRWS